MNLAMKLGWRLLATGAVAIGVLTLAMPQARAAGDTDALNITASLEHDDDDNLFRLPDDPASLGIILPAGASRSDNSNTGTLGLQFNGLQAKQKLSLSGQISDTRFTNNDYLNSVTGGGLLNWDWATAGDLSGTAGASYSRFLAGFGNSRDFSRNLVSGSRYYGTGRLGVGARWALVASGDYNKSTQDNAANDYHGGNGGIGIEYATPTGHVFGWDFKYATGDYVNSLSNYKDKSSLVRWKLQLGEATDFTGDAGYLRRTYDNIAPGAVGNFSGGIWNLALNWKPTGRTVLQVAGWRELRAWIDSDTDHYVSRGVSLSPGWNSGNHWKVLLTGQYELQDYIAGDNSTVTRSDKVGSAGATLTYDFLKIMELSASGRSERRRSTNDLFVYDDRIITVKLVASW